MMLGRTFSSLNIGLSVRLQVDTPFHRVWHCGLLSKFKHIFPPTYFDLLRSFPICKTFHKFTSDLPLPSSRNGLTATYAEDNTFLARSVLRREATDMVQDMLNEFEAWASRWIISTG